MNKTKKFIFLLIWGIIFFIMNMLVKFIQNTVTELLNIFSIIVFCPVYILIFSDTLKLGKLKERYYILMHIMYLALPIFLLEQYYFSEKNWMVFASPIVINIASLCNVIILNKTSISKNHIKYLKYWNGFITTCFMILLSFVSWWKSEQETLLFLFCISPLLILQMFYNRLDLK